MNDRREKKRGKSLGKAWKRADERTHLHVWRQRGRERERKISAKRERNKNFHRQSSNGIFFSLNFFFFTFRLEGKYPDWREGGEEENSTYFKLEIIKLPT